VVSHYPPAQPPAMTALLGGRNVRHLTRAQRLEIADLLERSGNLESQTLRARVHAVIDGTPTPEMKLLGILRRAAQNGA